MTQLSQSERRAAILDLIQKKGVVHAADLCEQFAVSDMTIRRDLRDMDREGLLRRTHGGAVSKLGRSYEPPYLLRASHNREYKQSIGRKAAELIYDGDSIALDVGTTTLEIVYHLEGRHNLTIVTSSLPIANALAARCSLETDVRLVITGGIVRAGELSMIGGIAEQLYGQLRVDKAFIGIGGISLADGLTEYNIEDALVKRRIIRSAREVIVVADSSKLGQTTFVSVAPLDDMDTLITDIEADPAIVRALEQEGINVLQAI